MTNIVTYPTNPVQGQEFTVGETIKVWDGEKWVNKTPTNNPHNVTKSQVGLGDVDNVSAANLRDRSTHTGTQPLSTISDSGSAASKDVGVSNGVASLDGTGKVPDTESQVSSVNGKKGDVVLTADQITYDSSETVKEAIDSKLDADYMALKIFQSPTDSGLTEIQTRTVSGGEVYEVRKTSDDSLATIYSDAAGTTEIVQDGTANVSDGAGVVEFYIVDTFEELKIEIGDNWVLFGGDIKVTAKGSDTPRTLGDRFADVVNVKDFGAVGQGGDDTLICQAAIDSIGAGAVRFPYGTYRLDGLRLKSNQTYIMEHAVFVPHTTSSTAIIADNLVDWGITGQCFFSGSRTAGVGGGGDTGECGLSIIGGWRFHVENVVFYKIAGNGLLRTTGVNLQTGYSEGGQYTNITADSCVNGVDWGREYEIFTNFKAFNCDIGFINRSGNLHIVGGSMADNDVGLWIPPGPNNAHGQCVGVDFNHNLTLAILVSQTPHGFTFGNCHVYASEQNYDKGGILIKASQGIVFNGGVYDCTIKIEESHSASGWHQLRNIFTPNDYGLKIINEHGERARTLITSGVIERNDNPVTHGDWNCANSVSFCFYSLSRDATDQLSIPQNTETKLPFTIIERQGDAGGRVTTNSLPVSTFSVPAGTHRVTSTLSFAGMDFGGNCYVTLKVDDNVHSRYWGNIVPVSVNGDTLTKFDINIVVSADSHIELFVTHNTSTPVKFGAWDVNQYLSIETLTS